MFIVLGEFLVYSFVRSGICWIPLLTKPGKCVALQLMYISPR
jgi:hypothetical protein